MMYIKSLEDNTVLVSQVTNETSQMKSESTNFDITTGCAGLAFKTKEPIFEPFAQSSEIVHKEELNPAIIGTIVQNLIAVPIFNEMGESIGVFEVINSQKSVFSTGSIKLLLMKFAKYFSLLLYTNGLLKVLCGLIIEYIGKLRTASLFTRYC